MILALLALAAASVTSDQASTMILAKRAFQACVRQQTIVLEKAGETAQATVDAAMKACANEEATYELAIMDAQGSDEASSDAGRARTRETMVKLTIDTLEFELVPAIMKKRASVR